MDNRFYFGFNTSEERKKRRKAELYSMSEQVSTFFWDEEMCIRDRLLHMVTKHPEMFDRLIEWENEDNIFHRRMTRREKMCIRDRDDIIVCDPEAEYFPLVQKLGGQVIRISPVSTDYINPLDINTNYSEEENPLTLKSDFILSMCELIVGGKDGLQPVEKTIIDRSVRMVYQEFLADPKPEKMPILEDLYNILRNQKEPEAQRIATALEIYVHGSLNVFNHRTTDVYKRQVQHHLRRSPLGVSDLLQEGTGTVGRKPLPDNVH